MPTIKKTTVAKPAAKKSTVVAKKTVVATPATRAKFTDTQKKAAAIKGGPGVKVAPKGTAMGTAQRTEAKRKAQGFFDRNGYWPTESNMKTKGGK